MLQVTAQRWDYESTVDDLTANTCPPIVSEEGERQPGTIQINYLASEQYTGIGANKQSRRNMEEGDARRNLKNGPTPEEHNQK